MILCMKCIDEDITKDISSMILVYFSLFYKHTIQIKLGTISPYVEYIYETNQSL